MKNSTYIIAGLLMLLWGLLTFGLHSSWYFDLLLVFAMVIILLKLFYGSKISN